MFTEQQQLLLTELGLGAPEPFLTVDFKRHFVYDPAYGVFYCASGPRSYVLYPLVKESIMLNPQPAHYWQPLHRTHGELAMLACSTCKKTTPHRRNSAIMYTCEQCYTATFR